jgi:hypothetical protein
VLPKPLTFSTYLRGLAQSNVEKGSQIRVGATYAERKGTLDLLFLEEAGQVAVANSCPLHAFPDD